MASPYIEGHRGRTFVIVLPGEVFQEKDNLHCFLEDVSLLNGLGIRLVIVVGHQQQIDERLRQQGLEPRFVGGYRVTDAAALKAAAEASGLSRMEVEAHLSRALSVPVVRRHARGDADSSECFHYDPAVRIVTGNFVTGKRRGVVDGVDFGATGSVRFVQADAVRQQLELGHVVLLSSLAYSAAGEVLNCNSYDVATHAAIELRADKIICVMDGMDEMQLPQWLPLGDAENLIAERAQAVADADEIAGNGTCNVMRYAQKAVSGSVNELEFDLDCWKAMHIPTGLLASVVACKNGVKRAHLVSAYIEGGLILELYSRDGVGCMISTDFYEGIRPAKQTDLKAIAELLAPLEKAGITKHRSRKQLTSDIPHFTVVERESKVLACALLHELGASSDGVQCGELAAFCVHPSYRGSGRGDSLLDYVEQQARDKGIRRLVLLTTRTADFFEQRDFLPAGVAHESDLIPESRRAAVDPARNSKLYIKALFDLDDKAPRAGKRIGF
ncbi:Amino-acid acetyltransferase [Coccomyxa sp. Obi]|nr:Amino-acid acetyltransferase [Coccomyxa sp. Obi]